MKGTGACAAVRRWLREFDNDQMGEESTVNPCAYCGKRKRGAVAKRNATYYAPFCSYECQERARLAAARKHLEGFNQRTDEDRCPTCGNPKDDAGLCRECENSIANMAEIASLRARVAELEEFQRQVVEEYATQLGQFICGGGSLRKMLEEWGILTAVEARMKRLHDERLGPPDPPRPKNHNPVA